MPGLTQVAPAPSVQFSSLAPLGVQPSIQNPMTTVPAQPQSADQWFANALDSNVSSYQGISQVSTCLMPFLFFFCLWMKWVLN